MANTVEIALVRHGRTDWNSAGRLQGRTDIPLSAAGHDDACQVANVVSEETWQALYTSPLARALTTAQIIGERIDLHAQVKECLIERSYGVLEGRTRAELRKWRSARSNKARPIAGMESDKSLRQRALRCLTDLAHTHSMHDRILVVSHGGFINAFLHCISNGRVGSGITQLANGSITRITWTAQAGWRIMSLNDISHIHCPQGQTIDNQER